MSLLDEATTAIEEVNEALTEWSRVFGHMWDMSESFFGSINFIEALALADLLYVAGDPRGAERMLVGWSQGDEDWKEYQDQWNEAQRKYLSHPAYKESDQ